MSAWADAAAVSTWQQRPELFPVVCPIDVDLFESYLVTHPNRPLVRSVCNGLRVGFWPCANISDNAPSTCDSAQRPLDEPKRAFLCRQRDIEIAANRFSPSFGEHLLPGMYSPPISVVPKPDGSDFRMITDHSAGKFAPNSWIAREDAHIKFDSLHDLGKRILQLRAVHGPLAPLVLWKSDVSLAYRHIPMHPLWQMKQIVTIDGRRHVDRCMVFGSRASARIWCTFFNLVLWIAVHVVGIPHLLAYMDDCFSVTASRVRLLYRPYQCDLPTDQTLLLRLWDRLHIAHKARKQVAGLSLEIIGFHVCPASMTFSLPPEKRAELALAIDTFLCSEDRRRSLREWQRLLGWCNWALNVSPLLRPALQSSYAKIPGGGGPYTRIFINKAVRADLTWFARSFLASPTRRIYAGSLWAPSVADLTVFCDASLTGLGFWVPRKAVAFAHTLSLAEGSSAPIFFLVALCVLSALEWVCSLSEPVRRVVIYTDSLNSVHLFGCLAGEPLYNPIVFRAVECLLHQDLDLRVLHIPGDRNTVADLLSRGLLDLACKYHPGLRILPFSPSSDLTPSPSLRC